MYNQNQGNEANRQKVQEVETFYQDKQFQSKPITSITYQNQVKLRPSLTQYSDSQSNDNKSTYSYSVNYKSKPQMFSYFFHDMEKEEKEYIAPKKQEQTLCSAHNEPVVMYSYYYMEFICQKCYEGLYNKEACYGLSDLQKPMEMLYQNLMQFTEGGKVIMLERYLQDYKAYLKQVKEARFKYLTDQEKYKIEHELNDIMYDLQMFWKKVEEMQQEYLHLKTLNDYETILLMYKRWSSICYDFKEKFLNFEYVRNLINKKIDPIMRPIAYKVGLCFMCMTNQVKVTCNNIKDENCAICKECANFCQEHGYFCRVHQEYHGERSADKQYLETSCCLCKYQQSILKSK